MNASRAKDALRLPMEQAAEHEHVLPQFLSTRYDEPEHDFNAKSHILDSYHQTDRSDFIIRMIKYNPAELSRLYATLFSCITSSRNTGCGRRFEFKSLDVLLMTLTVMKHGGSWDSLAQMFQVKGPTLFDLSPGSCKSSIRMQWNTTFINPLKNHLLLH